MDLDLTTKQYYAENLLEWYFEHKRDLPWRRTRDPYRIWVSEIMLQQTRVDTVIPYYERFIDKFPSIDALAKAPEEEVLKSWEGLGYYSRARNLQAAVREVKERYGSRVPDSPEEIRTLKGVGPYTAGAVLSIAYNVPEPAVDGNVLRVLSRYFNIDKDIAKASTRVYIEKLVREIIPKGKAGDFNQALMELGAVICTPKSPKCETCPVKQHCQGLAAGTAEQLPVKTKAKPPRPEFRLAIWAEGDGDKQDHVLLRQRPDSGLLADMWELPHVELPLAKPVQKRKKGAASSRISIWDEMMHVNEQKHHLQRLLFETEQVKDVRIDDWLLDANHTFSHIHWELRVFAGRYLSNTLPQNWHWVHKDDLHQLSFPIVFTNILKKQGWLE